MKIIDQLCNTIGDGAYALAILIATKDMDEFHKQRHDYLNAFWVKRSVVCKFFDCEGNNEV